MTAREAAFLMTIRIVGAASFLMLILSIAITYIPPIAVHESIHIDTLIQDLTYGWKIGFGSIAATLVGNAKGLAPLLTQAKSKNAE